MIYDFRFTMDFINRSEGVLPQRDAFGMDRVRREAQIHGIPLEELASSWEGLSSALLPLAACHRHPFGEGSSSVFCLPSSLLKHE